MPKLSTQSASALGAALLGVAALVALLVWQPWSSDDDDEGGGGSGLAAFGPTTMIIQDSDNNRTVVKDAREIEEAFPLPILLPSYLPDGYELANVTFFPAPPPSDALSGANRLDLWFDAPGPRRINITQSPGFNISVSEATEQLLVHGRTADYLALDRAEGVQSLAWAMCRRIITLESSPLNALTQEEILRIAESIMPDCEEDPTLTP